MLTRVVRIFDAFGPEDPVLSVSEISRRAGLPQATAARLVKEMTEHGLLARGEDRRVRIGNRMWELAERASPMQLLRETALQYMGDLQSVIGHSTQLAVLDGREALFVERLSAPDAVVNITHVGGRLPLHASSSGLVLLAHAPAELREKIIAGPLPAFTAQTIVDGRQLRAELAEIHRRGFAFCQGHIRPEATGLAVGVRRGGQVVAALGLVVPNDGAAWGLHRPLQLAGLALGRALSRSGRPAPR
ncbi:IclR family transcriptional regulator [Actinocorallia herbida]|uniref:IclR family transcriptional regulator n=1 Tax=Actinocorallia herbida TaxID=58109 RepID=UPI001FEC0ADD|nr:IclR family transcriptional regulator [Actinocorallia herbida]